MDTSVFIAQILGLLYLVVGVGIARNPAHYKSMCTDFTKSPALMYFGGAFSLMTGFMVVHFHNLWVSDWRVLITLIGWAALVKGAMLIVTPERMVKHTRYWASRMQNMSLIVIVLGAVFSYYGYVV